MKLPFIFARIDISVKCTCVFGQGHTLHHLVDPRCKCKDSHRRTPPAGVGASEF